MPTLAARRLALACLWAAGTALAAPGELLSIDWSTEGGFERTVPVPPGRFAEACGPLPAGQAVDWRFEASAPLDFNVHFHVGPDVRYPARQAAVRQASGTLEAPLAQDYCWMWTNRAAQPATLTLRLQQIGRAHV